MNHTESIIQRDICLYLQSVGIFCFSVPNEGAGGNAKRQMVLINMGLKKGAPDLVMMYPVGSVTFLEVKSKTGVISKSQRLMKGRCDKHGIEYHVVRSVEDVQELIK